MKKILLFALITLLFAGCSKDNGDPNIEEPPIIENKFDVTVDLKMPGTLASNIPNKEFKTIKIKGNLNGTDIKFIRGIIENLSFIDLEDANIVEGGDSYYNITHKTKNNIIGRFMFTELEGGFEIVLPKSVNKIEYEAFLSCKGLKSVVLNNNIKEIGSNAFSGCTQLSSIEIPESIAKLEFGTFRDCTSLKDVKLSPYLKTIELSAFAQCKSLTSVILPNSIVELEGQIFDGCSNLTNITLPSNITTLEQSILRNTGIYSIDIPEHVKSIKDYAFNGCNMITSINIPKNVSELGYIPFAYCIKLEKFEVDANNNTFSSIDGIITSKDKQTLIYYPCGKPGTTYSIPNSIIEIGDAAFFSCDKLEIINIPSSVKLIKDRAFSSSAGLKEVHCSATTPPVLGTRYNHQAFPNNVERLYIPKGSLEKYQNSIWSRYFKSIEEE